MNKLKNPLVIIANGEFPIHKIPLDILNRATSILACDGAADALTNKGYIPDIILGDLDSLSNKNAIKYMEHIVEVPDQSQIDFRKALNYAEKNDITDIEIIGATGKREDHTLGNIFSILNYKDLNIKLYTDTGFFTCIHKSQKIASFKGQQISIFTADNTIKITSNNLKYNFNKNNISNLYLGTLNESYSNEFELLISHGSLLIFQTYK
jgi:thiamine pyrophosphokinase